MISLKYLKFIDRWIKTPAWGRLAGWPVYPLAGGARIGPYFNGLNRERASRLNLFFGVDSSFFPAVPEGEPPGRDSDKVSPDNYLI